MTSVVLVHGWGGSFATTWQQSGFSALLEDAGRDVIGVDLLGHGTAPRPHEPEAYADLTLRIEEAMPSEPVDAVGFSLGALTLLHLAVRAPGRFSRVVLAGIGRNVFDHDTINVHAPELVADLPAGGTRLLQRSAGYKATIKRGMTTVEDGELTGNHPGTLQRGPQTL